MFTAFITGCATGFGRRLAERLLAQGHRVVATDRDPRTLDDLGPPGRVLKLALDVRHNDQVTAAVDAALAWGPVDVLVNNAGHAVFGTQEEVPLADIQDLFDVNVYGPIRVTRALLPALRASRGTIVQLSSVAGRMVFPESGYYAATKFAVEALATALSQETRSFGVRVRVIEPGAFATKFQKTAAAKSAPRSPESPYAGDHDTWDAQKLSVLESPQDPALVVDAILASLDDEAPFIRIPVGLDSARILAAHDDIAPDAWVSAKKRES